MAVLMNPKSNKGEESTNTGRKKLLFPVIKKGENVAKTIEE
jgi:hypothetical protein